jgi:hypothetical protein
MDADPSNSPTPYFHIFENHEEILQRDMELRGVLNAPQFNSRDVEAEVRNAITNINCCKAKGNCLLWTTTLEEAVKIVKR